MNLLEEIVKLKRDHLKNPLYSNNTLSGSIHVSDNSIIDLLRILDDRNLIDDLVTENKSETYIDDLIIGENISIELALRKDRFCFYFDIYDLIKFNQNCLPNPYYIFDEDFLSNEDKTIVKLDVLNNIYDIVDLLKSLADYRDDDLYGGLKLVFIQSRISTFKIKIKPEDLCRDYNFTTELKTQFREGSIGREEKIAIFKNVLITLLHKEGESFSTILSNWSIICDNYKKSHELYIEGFSIEKIKSEIDNEKINLCEKLHHVLSGLNSRIISVPIGFFLVVSQFDYSGQNELKNIALMIGVIAFLFIEFSLLEDNKSLINSILKTAKEISEKNKIIKESSFFDEIESEARNIKRRICSINIIIALIAIAVVILCAILN